jgi:cholesterol oxidase
MSDAAPGLGFRERMSGWVSTLAKSDPRTGARQAEADRQWAEIVIDIDYVDLAECLRNSGTEARVRGSVLVAGLSPVVMQVTEGTFRLFVQERSRVQLWQMHYALDLRSQEGTEYSLHGVKDLRYGSPFDAWPHTTTCHVTVTNADGKPAAAGIVRPTVGDVLRLLGTMHVTQTDDRLERLWGVTRFLGLFGAMLLRQNGGLLGEPWAFPPRPVPAPPEPGPPAIPPAEHWCTGDAENPTWVEQEQRPEKAWLHLTRYHGGDRGPVVLAPGFGMTTDAYRTHTITKNLKDFLLDNDYDVWLFGYRASPELESARQGFTIDDVAQQDWPTAIAKVVECSGKPSVQVIGHCVGSMSFQMAMLWPGNAEMRTQVRSAVCSQVTVHPVSTWFNSFKVRMKLGPVIERMSPYLARGDRRTLLNHAYHYALRIAPTPRGEHCRNGVCQWITAYYGLTHHHDQLDDDTHNDLSRLFGIASVRALRHIGDIIVARKALDHEGNDVYIGTEDESGAGNAANLAIPILFLAGEQNKIFYPQGSLRTLNWLREHNRDVEYDRLVLPEYAHLDGFIGRNAHEDVFPAILAHLEKPASARVSA